MSSSSMLATTKRAKLSSSVHIPDFFASVNIWFLIKWVWPCMICARMPSVAIITSYAATRPPRLEVALVDDDLTAQQQTVLRKHVNKVLHSTYTSPCLHVGGKWRDDSGVSQPVRRVLKALNSDCYPWWQLTQAQKLAFPGVLMQFCGAGNGAWDDDEELMTAAIAAAADVVESM